MEWRGKGLRDGVGKEGANGEGLGGWVFWLVLRERTRDWGTRVVG